MSNLLPPVHVPKEQRKKIDKLIESGLYPSRYAFVKKAVEEKLEREES